IADCVTISATAVSPDTYHEIVYMAALPCCSAVLRASGYRTHSDVKGGHDILIQCLSFTLDLKLEYVKALQAARIERRKTAYDSVSGMDKNTVDALLKKVRGLRAAVEKWIRDKHPE